MRFLCVLLFYGIIRYLQWVQQVNGLNQIQETEQEDPAVFYVVGQQEHDMFDEVKNP